MGARRWIGPATAGVAGLALRVWVYRSAVGAPDSDEAVVGLMARHALHGELTIFFWGQPYGGSQEAWLAAPLVAVFGSGLLTLRSVPILLGAAAAVLVWRVGRRTIGERPAIAAGAVLWLWPPYTVVHGVPAYGFYGTNLFYASLLLLLVLRTAELPSVGRVAWLGLVLGLGFWQTAQIIPIVVPALVWLVWRRRDALRVAWAAIPAAAIGALPWILWNVEHDWQSFLAHSDAVGYVRGLRLFVSPLLPMLLGVRAPLTSESLLPSGLWYVLYALALTAFVVAAVRTRTASASLLYFVAAAFPFIWALSHRVAIQTSVPVYLTVLSPVLALLVAHAAADRPRALLVVGACLAVSVVTIHRLNASLASAADYFPPRTPRNLQPLVSALERLGQTRIYAQYWIAYRLDLASGERIVASPDDWAHWSSSPRGIVTPVPARHSGRGINVRYEPYRRTVARDPSHGYLFFRRPYEATPIVTALRRHRYRRVSLGEFVLWLPPPS